MRGTRGVYGGEAEPCLASWTDRLGFTLVAEVPHEDGLGFAMLQRDGFAYRGTRFHRVPLDSAEADIAGLVDPAMPPTTALFLRVREFEALEQALEGAEVVVPERRTSYTAREMTVRAPCGTLVGLALAD